LSAERQKTKRRLAIDLEELEAAFDDASGTLHYYLDLETGKVVVISDEIRDELQAIYAMLDEQSDGDAFNAAIGQSDQPDWMREVLMQAHQVEQGYGTTYIDVPKADSRAGYRAMADFIDTVADRRFQAKLEAAIQGRGAFRRFKDALLHYPDERERWFTFNSARVRERVLAWLAEEGIAVILE
jgi:hypothetical protein